jgi:acetyl-CoA/propionyl-CoA carboxylase biotin carboxyl carrier protein
VRSNDVDTTMVERVELPAPPHDDEAVMRAAALCKKQPRDVFCTPDGWRLGGPPAPSWWTFSVDGGEPAEIVLEAGAQPDPRWVSARDGEDLWLGRDGYAWRVHQPSPEEAADDVTDGDLRAPMPGSVLKVAVADGDAVEAGDTIIVVESMKMELTLDAPSDGTVELLCKEGDRVSKDQVLARVDA